MELDEKAWYGRMLIENVLAVDVPIISAVNGPCSIHSEVPLLSDIVLASEDRLLPGPRALPAWSGARRRLSTCSGRCSSGRTGPRYMLLMGKKLSAQEALEWGVVAEVLPKDQLVDRAWEVARELVQRPPLVLRYTRQLFTQNLKRAFLDELGHGLARRDLRPAPVLPPGRRHAGPRPGVGSGALVRLTDTRV